MSMTPPQPWGPARPPTPPRRRTGWIVAGTVGGGLLLLIMLGAIATGGGDQQAVAPATDTTKGERADRRTATSQPAATEPTEAEPEGPERAKVGDTLEFIDALGDRSADITIVRARTSKGDQFLRPENGVYVGLLVRMRAYQDNITVPQFYARVDGRRFERTFTLGFEPSLDSFEANAGETVEGWIVFDMPSQHGELVMQEVFEGTPQAIWEY